MRYCRQVELWTRVMLRSNSPMTKGNRHGHRILPGKHTDSIAAIWKNIAASIRDRLLELARKQGEDFQLI